MTPKGDYGHFAWMLIDVDLSKPLSDSLMHEFGEIVSFPLWIMRTFWIFVLLALY